MSHPHNYAEMLQVMPFAVAGVAHAKQLYILALYSLFSRASLAACRSLVRHACSWARALSAHCPSESPWAGQVRFALLVWPGAVTCFWRSLLSVPFPKRPKCWVSLNMTPLLGQSQQSSWGLFTGTREGRLGLDLPMLNLVLQILNLVLQRLTLSFPVLKLVFRSLNLILPRLVSDSSYLV